MIDVEQHQQRAHEDDSIQGQAVHSTECGTESVIPFNI